MSMDGNQHVCSFCGLPGGENRRLIEGDNCYICEMCISVCYQMLNVHDDPLDDNIDIHSHELKDFVLDLTPQEI